MKKALFALTVFAGLSASAQITQDENGNYFQVKKEVVAHDSTTTRTFTNSKGEAKPVYVGKKGAHYIAAYTSKGLYYRKYLVSGSATIGTHEKPKN
jgi:hypothetical protein